MKDNELEKICESYLSVGVQQVNEDDEIPTRTMERENPTNVGGSPVKPAIGVEVAAGGAKQALTHLAASLRGPNIPSNINIAMAKIAKDTGLNVQAKQLETILEILASVVSDDPTKQAARQQLQAPAPQKLGGQTGGAPTPVNKYNPRASAGPKPWQSKIGG